MKDFDEIHAQRLLGYVIKIDKSFNQLIKDVVIISSKYNKEAKKFSFNHPVVKKEVDVTFKNFNKTLYNHITSSMYLEWGFANEKNDALEKNYYNDVLKYALLQGIVLPKTRPIFSNPTTTHKSSLKTIIDRKIGGLRLSDRVWNITNNTKKEIELSIKLTLDEGKSAKQQAKEIKKHLKYPDKLFKKVRDKKGVLRLSENAKMFHPGQGVYRSSYKNALRLSKHEINKAFHVRDLIRMQQNTDVVGFDVVLSKQHKVIDICDYLKGRYPKWFVFVGWHVGCKCQKKAVMKSKNEVLNEIKKGINKPSYTSKNYVKNVPKGFNKWVTENKKRMSGWKSKPDWIRDNFIEGDINKGLIKR